MSTARLVIQMVVVFVGFPAALRNPTALGLVCAWLAGQITWLLTGNIMPRPIYFVADLMVIGLMYGKAFKAAEPWRTKLFHIFTDLTPWDRAILALFVFAVWPLYVADIHEYYRWYGLWALLIVQFMLAGAEALFSHRKPARPTFPNIGDNGFAFSGVRFAW